MSVPNRRVATHVAVPRQQPPPAVPAATASQAPCRKRKRDNSPFIADKYRRTDYMMCAICEATFNWSLPWGRDNIYARQCRTCADQLERREKFDEFGGYGRRLF